MAADLIALMQLRKDNVFAVDALQGDFFSYMYGDGALVISSNYLGH